MSIIEPLIVGYENGARVMVAQVFGASFVGAAVAQTYGASRGQALVLLSVKRLMSRILKYLVGSYLKNTRQLLLADIVIMATSSLAGVLATRLFCEKTIKWKHAFASSVIFDAAAIQISLLLMEPRPLSEK